MAVDIRGTTVGTAAGSMLTLGNPARSGVYDVLVGVCAGADTEPPGWTPIVFDATVPMLIAWRRLETLDDLTTTSTWTASSPTTLVGGIIALRGAEIYGPIAVVGSVFSAPASNPGETVPIPGLTTTQPNQTVLSFAAAHSTTDDLGAFGGGQLWSQAAGAGGPVRRVSWTGETTGPNPPGPVSDRIVTITPTTVSHDRAGVMLAIRETPLFQGTGSLVVPAGQTELLVDITGCSVSNSAPSGLGEQIRALLPVTPGETLTTRAGARPTNGGGLGTYFATGTVGGGASDIRRGGDALADRILIAGGGGGLGRLSSGAIANGGNAPGGNGGNFQSGATVIAAGGKGATTTAGGAGGTYPGHPSFSVGAAALADSLGQGGNPGCRDQVTQGGFTSKAMCGGGGGGGLYGGGGGAYASQLSSFPEYGYGGGGAGTSFIDPSCRETQRITGTAIDVRTGRVHIRWFEVQPAQPESSWRWGSLPI